MDITFSFDYGNNLDLGKPKETYNEKVEKLCAGRVKSLAFIDMQTGEKVYECESKSNNFIRDAFVQFGADLTQEMKIKLKLNYMKDNLLPFDLEEAKKDPSRVRYQGKQVTDFHVLSNGYLVFLPVGDNHPVSVFKSISGDWNYFDLRLTPKRMFVNGLGSNEPTGTPMLGTVHYSEAEAKRRCERGYVTYELIPVKEDE